MRATLVMDETVEVVTVEIITSLTLVLLP
jgi:hypothetical protein